MDPTFIEAVRRRLHREAVRWTRWTERRRRRAWALARRAAHVLRDHFGAQDVILFGSWVRGDFTPWSDVDLAVSGIPAGLYWKAVAAVERLYDRRYRLAIDLHDLADLPPAVRQQVEAEGCGCEAARPSHRILATPDGGDSSKGRVPGARYPGPGTWDPCPIPRGKS